MTDLTHKDVPFAWNPQADQAFKELKKQMTEAPVLCIPDQDHPFTVMTNASDFAVGAVLMQDQGQGPQPVAFTSRKMNPAEQNYAAHEKETLTIMHASRSGKFTWKNIISQCSQTTPPYNISLSNPTCPEGKQGGLRKCKNMTSKSNTSQASKMW